jgi:hypothetical protein
MSVDNRSIFPAMVGSKTTERRSNMLVVNFSHPITEAQKSQIEAMVNSPIQIKTVRVQVDQESPFEPQVQALLGEVGLSPAEWQQPILINLPGLSPVLCFFVKKSSRG